MTNKPTTVEALAATVNLPKPFGVTNSLMSLLLSFLAAYIKARLRGSYRLTHFLARKISSLQCVPIQTESGTLYADLRITSSHGILANPRSDSGEDLVMREFIKSGDTVFDIGAHLGLYTLLLSKLVGDRGKVFAFEPNSRLLPSLTETIRRLANVKLFPIALSNQNGEVDLFVPENYAMTSLSDWTQGIGGQVRTFTCQVTTLNYLLKTAEVSVPQFIKCDVEGAELLIFKGASEVLDRHNAPIILFELNNLAAKSFNLMPTNYFEFLESFKNVSFVFFEVLPEGIKRLESKNIEYANVLAVPETKLDLCQNLLIT